MAAPSDESPAPIMEPRRRPWSASAPPAMVDTQRSIVPTFRRGVVMVVLPLRGVGASGVPSSAEALEIEAALASEERGPEIAAPFHAGGDVVETEIVDRDAPLDLRPGDR